MKPLFKQPFFYTTVLSLSLLGLIIGNYVFGWVTPTAAPPAGNVTLSQGALPAGSPGYVQFASSSTAFGGDAGFFWDNTNKRLGIGTTAPLGKLHVEGDVRGYILSSNRYPVGLETNILFNATNRYTVSQSGSTFLSLFALFDGIFSPTYSPDGVDPANPLIILIENLPSVHTQVGAWVGWTTRYWPPSKFKIEGYDISGGYNNWRIIADYSTISYSGSDFLVKIPIGGIYTKLRLTIYEGTGNIGANGYRQVGLSELFFLHPEGQRLYSGLLPTSMWEVAGNVGIGMPAPGAKLHVAGSGGYASENGPLMVTDSTTPSKKVSIGYDTTYDAGFISALYSGVAWKNLILQGGGGNVGIGTTAPAYKLDVVGDVRISGNLIASANTLADCAWTAYTCNASQICPAPKVMVGVERYTTGALCGTAPTQWYQMRLYCCNL